MGPIATLWTRAMRDRGHEVTVVSAFPHYPPALFSQRWRPYRERRDRIPVLRLPLRIGHATARQRIIEELTYATSLALAAPILARPDAIVAVSPSFLALGPAMANAAARRVPWILWLQDIFPDAAETTGLLGNPWLLRVARAWERLAYRRAAQIVAISETFASNLRRKGVPESKIDVVYNPATRGFGRRREPTERPRILWMGNVGHSQGLVELVRAFGDVEDNGRLELLVVGAGEEEAALRNAARPGRVEVLGLVDDDVLDRELARASLGLVSQRSGVEEFNVPSKLMTLMAKGVPIIANVRPDSEAAALVRRAGAGWVTDSARPAEAVRVAAAAVHDHAELKRRGAAAEAFAREHFDPERLAERFEQIVLRQVRRA